ncbi:PD-(D/E)XK nuclease family protein [Nitrosomonas sp. Is37]|uniref:PD-(D/E)XK nuclease family protein n=1 Tax=Nitrosomonas sp. Is37 TaxID=3080535 RepID=UPI00294AD809|nr:PD-(D/E)XK nuclease family protein [Nitrosomonas sp. Is37]MDV6343736.1 PD-(D/E)XK nuclease family protein [Nitrosomonas sp. Is37]
MKVCRLDLQLVDSEDILVKLNQGITLITGNQRLTHVFRQHSDQAAILKGAKVWSTPDILPWHSWLQRLWEEALISGEISEARQLLAPQQERALWQELLSADLPFQPMGKAALQVQKAWQLLWEWHLPQNESIFQYNDDSRLFWKWQLLFQRTCQQKGWLSPGCLPDKLRHYFEQGTLLPPDELVLIGFDELNPQQLALLETLNRSGCHVQWLQLKPKVSQIGQLACTDRRQEAKLMARWVRQRLEDNPAAQIGIVVPNLSALREIIVQALDEILMPSVFHPGHQQQERSYNMSLGKPLTTFPLVTTALKLLDLLKHTISLSDISQLLHSPFIGGWEQESSARALLDVQLREIGEPSVSIDTLSYHASQTNRSYACVVLAKKLGMLKVWLQTCSRKEHPEQWVQHFDHLLKTIGWLEGYPLSSEEYQTVEAWHALLAELATLDWVTGEISLSDVLSQLWQMARERIFQPQTGVAPVQVLGPLEAHGIQFDYLWMIGLHDGIWPGSPQPNPFIPLPLQRNHELPHSSEQRELSVTRLLMQRIVTSADQVILSYPQRNGDEELRASPLIKGYTSLAVDALLANNMPSWREIVHDNSQLSELLHDPAPILEQTAVKGGSHIFKLQAACPFRAFAELRLGARPLGQIQIGLNAMARGNLLHRAMEKVWDKLDSYEQLLALPDTELSELVLDQVQEVINTMASHYPQTFNQHFRDMEIKRLHRQVATWLELEKKRLPFRVIARERKYELTVGALSIQLKIDRIDEIAASRQLIIDYKTGQAKASQWFGDRPDEPQLPLYSLIFPDDLAGIAFAQLRTGQMAFSGVTIEEGILPEVKSYEKLSQSREIGNWPQLLTHWRVTLERLSDSFCRGEAAVDPKRYPATCAYCTLQPLCRITELTLLGEVDIEEGEGEG